MLTFALAALVLIMIPGPDQALITRFAVVGRRPGLMTMLGGSLGVSVHATAAALGISALLLASATAFLVLKVVGAAYLIWLGVQALRSARRTRREPCAALTPGPTPEPTGPSGGRCLRQGFLSNALNPKVALFFVTFLPQFIPAGAAVLPTALALSAIFAVLYLAWFSLYVIVVARVGDVLRRPRVRAALEAVTGVLLIGFGVRLVLQQR